MGILDIFKRKQREPIVEPSEWARIKREVSHDYKPRKEIALMPDTTETATEEQPEKEQGVQNQTPISPIVSIPARAVSVPEVPVETVEEAEKDVEKGRQKTDIDRNSRTSFRPSETSKPPCDCGHPITDHDLVGYCLECNKSCAA